MKIKISNKDKIIKEIIKAEKGCSARLLKFEDLNSIIEQVEKRLNILLPKTYWNGLSVVFGVGFGGRKPASYQGTPFGTYIYLERGVKEWFVTCISRQGCTTNDYFKIVGLGDKVEKLLETASKIS